MTQKISKATFARLPVYLNYLKSLPETGNPYISATGIAAALGMGEVQVRKDLASVSGAGKPKVGYVVRDLMATLSPLSTKIRLLSVKRKTASRSFICPVLKICAAD